MKPRIGIVGYRMGNITSLRNALVAIGADAFIAAGPEELREATHLVLPGVGAFPKGMEQLHTLGFTPELRRLVLDEHRPLLGICLGMQLLASRSTEFGEHEGLGLIPGSVDYLATDSTLRIPHVGWNDVAVRRADPIVADLGPEPTFYFVHSFEFHPSDPDAVTAVTDYGRDVTACVGSGRVFGVQFHPEKSGDDGLTLLRSFVAC